MQLRMWLWPLTMVIWILIPIHFSNWQCPPITALPAQQLQRQKAELVYKLLSLTWNFTVLISEPVRLSTNKCPRIGLQRQHFPTLPQTHSSSIVMSYLPSWKFCLKENSLFWLLATFLNKKGEQWTDRSSEPTCSL